MGGRSTRKEWFGRRSPRGGDEWGPVGTNPPTWAPPVEPSSRAQPPGHLRRPITEYYAAVDPFFVAPEGRANGDHPYADIRLGQESFSDVTTAFMRSAHWRKGAMFINYDEWGGFFGHVVPPATAHEWDPGRSRRAVGTMRDAFDPTIADPDHPGDPEVDVDAYEYVAPAEARLSAVPIPTSAVSDLWGAADWLDAQGYQLNTRFADALPFTR